jgi:hypothetical protein
VYRCCKCRCHRTLQNFTRSATLAPLLLAEPAWASGNRIGTAAYSSARAGASSNRGLPRFPIIGFQLSKRGIIMRSSPNLALPAGPGPEVPILDLAAGCRSVFCLQNCTRRRPTSQPRCPTLPPNPEDFWWRLESWCFSLPYTFGSEAVNTSSDGISFNRLSRNSTQGGSVARCSL